MMENIVEQVAAWCERNGRVLDITGTGGPEDIYLRRYYLVRSRWFNIFIHRFLRSDRDDLHDHPWDFMTYLVSGSYRERRWDEATLSVINTHRNNYEYEYEDADGRILRERYQNNRLVFRRAEDQHQVLVDRSYTLDRIEEAPLTVCITGPVRRDWGFIKEELVVTSCPDGIKGCAVLHKKKVRRWIPWRQYLGLPSNAPGRG